MGNIVNLVGRRFGMLTVVQRVGKNSSNHIKWECICDCGNTTEATGSNLKCGQRVVDRINFYTEYLVNYSYQFFDGVNTETLEKLRQIFTDIITQRKQDEIKRLKQSL